MLRAIRAGALLFPLLLPGVALGGGAATIERSFGQSYSYEIRTLAPRAFVYTDREYVFSAMHRCLLGQTYLATPNSDKFSRGGELVLLRLAERSHVYIGYDSRYRGRPAWLSPPAFTPTNQRITVSDPRSNREILTFVVWQGVFPPGPLMLGGNLANGERSNFGMYTAIIVPDSATGSAGCF